MSEPSFTDDFGGPYYQNVNHILTNRKSRRDGSVDVAQTAIVQQDAGSVRGPHTKNWKRDLGILKKAWIPPSTYERGAVNLDYEVGIWRRDFASGDVVSQQIKGPPILAGSWAMLRVTPHHTSIIRPNWDGNAVNEARIKTMKKLADGKYDLGVELAEARRTADLLADTFSDLARAALAVKRGNIPSLKRLLSKHLSGRDAIGVKPAQWWLQYRYGWKPLVNTVYNSYELLTSQLERPLLMSAQVTIPGSSLVQGQVVHPGFVTSGGGVWSTRCRVHAALDSRLFNMANTLGVSNPASIAWELVPFSFVIDWGLPIGDLLEAMSASQGLDFIGGWDAYRSEFTATAIMTPFTGYMPERARIVSASGFYYKRTPLSSFPALRPYAKSPFSTANVITAVALHRQLR